MDQSEAERIVLDVLESIRRAVAGFPVAERAVWVATNPFNDDTFRVDLLAERAAVKALENLGFDGLLVSEESGRIRMGEGGSDVVLDPLDGSRNAIKGIPFYSSSIAVAEGPEFRNIVAAGVMDLVRGVMIYSRGGQVYINGKAASPSRTTALERAYVSILLKLKELLNPDEYGARALRVLKRVGYPRLFGSAALETAYVAVGLLDAFVDLVPRLRVFDVAPSLYLVKTAGGCVRVVSPPTLDDLPLTGEKRIAFIAAGNEGLCEEIYRLMRPF